MHVKTGHFMEAPITCSCLGLTLTIHRLRNMRASLICKYAFY